MQKKDEHFQSIEILNEVITDDVLSSSDCNSRYPCGSTRSEYCRVVGELRQNQIAKAMCELLPNHLVENSRVNGHGADIKVYDEDNNLVGKFEVKNEASSSYFKFDEVLRIDKNLEGVDYSGVICSFGILKDKDWSESGVDEMPFDLCILGYQIQPKDYHAWFNAKKDTYKRREDNLKNYMDTKKQLKMFLGRIGMLHKTDADNSMMCHVCTIINKEPYSIVNSNVMLYSGVLKLVQIHVLEPVYRKFCSEISHLCQESMNVKRKLGSALTSFTLESTWIILDELSFQWRNAWLLLSMPDQTR